MLGSVHLLISLGKRNRLFRVTIPSSLAIAFLSVAVLLPLVSGVLLIDRGHRVADQRKLASLRSENTVLHAKMDGYAQSVDSLRSQLQGLAELDAQLRLSSSMPLVPRDVREMGIGGGTVGSNEPGAELDNSIDWLLEQAKFQRSSFYDIACNLEKQAALQSGTPSIMPTSGWIASSFGFRRDPFTGKSTFHEGLDIIGIPGQPIIATASGTVVIAGPYQNWGNVVEIDHGKGLHSFYAHNASVKVKVGDKVTRGQTIALLGSTGRSTGYHCHYGIKLNGNWVDPSKYILQDQNPNN
jgi:murein DD-endopeptidase MepM/ murein hydrolase activator NlpD